MPLRVVRGWCVVCALLCPWVVTGQSVETRRAVSLYRERSPDAEAALRAAAEAGDPWAHYWLGRVSADRGDPDAAAEHLERAVRLGENVSEFHLWLGRAYAGRAQRSLANKLGLAGRAKREWELAASLDSASIAPRIELVRYLMLAPGLFGGDAAEAKRLVLEIRRLSPYAGGMQAAWVASREGRTGEAESEYRALVRSFPDSLEPLSNLGYMLQEQRRWDEAFALYDAALSHNEVNAVALYGLGRTASLASRRLHDGVAALRAYLEIPVARNAPPYSGAHFRIGTIQEQLGDTAAARASYERALALDPKDESARKALARLP